MLARITDNHWIYLDQVTQGTEECIVNHFSVRDPRAYFLESAWDGWYRRYFVSKQKLSLPFLRELILCCEKHKIPLEIQDLRGAPKYPAPQEEQITENFLDGIKLEPYQVNSLRTCCREEIGLINAVTGAGKTEIACGLVKMFRCPTIIVTEQIVVLEQIVERLTLRGVVHNNDIGLFCYGNTPDNNLVIVGSIQSLSSPSRPKKESIRISMKQLMRVVTELATKRDERIYHIFPRDLANALCDNPDGAMQLKGKYLQLLYDYCFDQEWKRRLQWYKTRLEKASQVQALVKKCDLLLVDEADLSTSAMYRPLFTRWFNGRRRYGFSGTPFDSAKPVQNLLLKENLGVVICEASREEVQARGRIIPIKFFMLAIGENGDRHDSRTYDVALKEELVENQEFHETIAGIVNSFPKDGTLILVDTSPIEPLGLALEQLIPNSKFIFGNTPKKERREYIELFENRKLCCLIGSKILKRGLDLKGGVENLILVGGGAKWSDFNQKIGRAVRVNQRGWARVFGFFFLNNKYLYKHSRENLKALVSLGYKATVIVGGQEIDGEKFIRSKFRVKYRSKS